MHLAAAFQARSQKHVSVGAGRSRAMLVAARAVVEDGGAQWSPSVSGGYTGRLIYGTAV